MGKILITAAVRQELAAFHSADGRILRLTTGMGKGAGRSVRDHLRRRPVDWVISVGFAGGACPGLRVGDLILASEVREQATGRVFRPSPLPERMREVAQVGPLVTVSSLLDPAGKAQVGSRWGAVAVEMETVYIAAAAEEAGVRWLALRVILDPLEVLVSVRSMSQALGWAAQPWRWARLARFWGSVRTAGESLARGLELLVQQVVSPD